MHYIIILLLLSFSCCLSSEESLLRSSQKYFSLSQETFLQAKRSLREFLKREPHNKKGRILLAKIYFKENKYQQAFEIFSGLQDSLDSEALFYYANILEDKNLFLEAKKIYRKIKKPPYSKLSQERIRSIEKKIILEMPDDFIKEILTLPSLVQAKECGGEILYINEEIEITPDNQQISTIHFIARVINDRGKSLGEITIGYDSTYEEILSLEARTITSQGKIIEVGEENIRDVSRYLEYPLYSNSRVRIISMPQIEDGCLIEYKVKIKKLELINKKDFSLVYVLKDKYPIKKAIFNLKVPVERRINIYEGNQDYLPKNTNFKFSKIKEGRYFLYHWEFEDIPPLVEEPSSVPHLKINPYMIITSFSSWGEIYSWWRSLYRDKIEPTPALRKKVRNLLKDTTLQEEILRKIYEFCASQIRYVAVEYGKAGFQPHPAQEILINRYGDCKDQSILLISMLRLAGIKAWPVLLSTYEGLEVREDKPCLNFNHCIVLAELDDRRRFFLDPTSETSNIYTLPFADEDRVSLVFFDRGYRILKTPLQKRNFLYTYMEIEKKEEGFYIQRRISSQGLFSLSQRYLLRYTHPQIIEEKLLQKAKQIMSDSSLLSWRVNNERDVNNPLVIEYSFKGKNFFNTYADLRIPFSFSQVPWTEEFISRKERLYPLFLGSLQCRKTKIIFAIPKGFKVRFLPQPLNLSSSWMEYKRVFYLSESKKLVFKEVILIKEREVAPSSYKKFKEFYENLINRVKEVPVFVVKA